MRVLLPVWVSLLAAAACSPGTSGTGDGHHGPTHGPGSGVDAGTAHRGDAGGSTPTPMTETCNGADDDGDGMVDEGCMCVAGSTQACWPGDPSQRGVGACHDGTQTCVAGSEFASFGDCAGATLPSAEVLGNCTDEDCDGIAQGCTCGELEDCGNSVDDNCDGYVDCDDATCAGTPACAPHCEPEICGNGADDDCDGLVDMADTDCCTCAPGATRFCDEPVYCNWGLQTCGPDGQWGACTETDARPPGCTDGLFGFDASYDEDCCISAGACCQDGFGSSYSRGNCAGITECLR